MKHDLTTGTWQDDTGCPISIILVTTSDGGEREANGRWSLQHDMRRRPSRIEKRQRGREYGRRRHRVKMRHNNQPVRTKGGGG